MKNKILIIITIIFSVHFMYSQTVLKNENYKIEFDSTTHKRIYRIGFSTIHTIELIELKTGEYTGNLINLLTQYKRKNTKDFVQKIRIPDLTVKQLMNELHRQDIETLEDCGNILSAEYDCVSSLDGDGTWFVVLTKRVKRVYEFDALYPGGKESDKFPEKQKKAQRILNLINERFDLKKTLHQFMKHLPSGTYGYYGISMIKLS